MARGARAKFRPATHSWVVVTKGLYCALGGHDVPAGGWVRFRRGDPFRRASCETCLKARGIERPIRKVTMNFDEDVRAKRAGDD